MSLTCGQLTVSRLVSAELMRMSHARRVDPLRSQSGGAGDLAKRTHFLRGRCCGRASVDGCWSSGYFVVVLFAFAKDMPVMCFEAHAQ